MEYDEQVTTIVTVLTHAQVADEKEVDRFLMPYIMDKSFNRGAICQARKELLDNLKQKE